MEDQEDAELIHAYVNGDERAFDVLVSRYVGPMYRFLFRMVRNAQTAEDLSQETFVKVWRYIKRYDKTKSFKAWIFAIARNTALDALRKKDPITFTALEREDANGEDMNLAIDIEDARPLPDEVAIQAETAEALDRMLARLPPKQQAVILLHNAEGLTFQEIGDALHESLNTVKSRYRRAVERLKILLNTEE
jgi:RNA polymerase sigma-70 factor (ECF subfamily)